jgi:hypothetical protein
LTLGLGFYLQELAQLPLNIVKEMLPGFFPIARSTDSQFKQANCQRLLTITQQ